MKLLQQVCAERSQWPVSQQQGRSVEKAGFKNELGRTTLAGGAWAGVTFNVLNTGSWGLSKVFAITKASSLLNLSNNFLSRSEILESVEEVEDLAWSVVEVVVGRLEDDFTNLSDLAGLADVVEDFLLSAFLDFFSASPLKPEVVWPSTTPTTDTSAGSTRVGLRVSDA